jgi:hypothetical protein
VNEWFEMLLKGAPVMFVAAIAVIFALTVWLVRLGQKPKFAGIVLVHDLDEADWDLGFHRHKYSVWKRGDLYLLFESYIDREGRSHGQNDWPYDSDPDTWVEKTGRYVMKHRPRHPIGRAGSIQALIEKGYQEATVKGDQTDKRHDPKAVIPLPWRNAPHYLWVYRER